MKKRKPVRQIRVFEEDARIFNSMAKRKGLPQPDFFRMAILKEDDLELKKKGRGFRFEL